ncbi:hypothetical protein ACLQ3C_10860 [Gordonia sp. DT30]|uniref:hypothetical protein n=1 Tax=unclassified Gordonia (in: high G+C Gram-positive bacteria) TaxID=2657482 RepID=UPI003CF354E3
MLTASGGRDAGHVLAGDELVARWSAAVAAGAHGRGAAALTALAAVVTDARVVGDRPVASLACSTAASLYRQAGRHRDALIRDGHALLLAGADMPGRSAWARAAACDALINLAADNLGLGRFGAARRLLDRADELAEGSPSGADAPWLTDARCRLRALWVRAELAIYSDDPDAALDAGQRATAMLADRADGGTQRHRIKTGLIVAAAQAATGHAEVAMQAAIALGDASAEAGLRPLQWAALSLQQGLGDTSAQTVAAVNDLYRFLHARGMPFVRSHNDR